MATRRERVVLELEDQFTTGMARAAASAALLNKELDSLSRESVRTQRSFSDIDSSSAKFGRNAAGTSREVDKLSGRMRILADVAAVLGPSLVPIGGVGIAAISGLASQLGFAATAGATAVLAFQGIGDTLKALNKAALEPTTANIEAAHAALEGLPPEAQKFVAQIGKMIPELQRLQDVAAAGLFPGATEGLADLEKALPRVQGVIAAVSQELGQIAADTGESLASDRWAPFLAFIEREAPGALADMATAAGNTAHAVASLWVATKPLNDDFSSWLVRATASIDHWASSLQKTQGFADFVAYVEQTGPQVAATLGAIADAAIQIVQATAPLGGPVLKGLEALANVVAAIADSDLGTPLFTAAAAMALFNRTMSIGASLGATTFGGMVKSELQTSAGITRLIGDLRALRAESNLSRLAAPGVGFIGPLTQAQSTAERLRRTLPALAKTSALIGGITVASTGAADKIGLTNAASLALAGTFVSPGWGTAIGAAVGATLDLAHANDDLEDALKRSNLAVRTTDLDQLTASTKELRAQLKGITDDQAHTSIGDFLGDTAKHFGKIVFQNPLKPGSHDPADDIRDALSNNELADQTRRAADAQALLADGFATTAGKADSATQSTKAFQRSLEKLNEVLSGRASFRDYEQALDDFTERQTKRAEILSQIGQERADLADKLARNSRDIAGAKTASSRADLRQQRVDIEEASAQRIKDLQAQADALKNSLDIGTQAGRDTQELLDNIAATALKVAQGLDPVKRAEFLAAARQEFIKTAENAGLAKDAAKSLADQVLGLSNIVGRPKIVIDKDGAWHVIDDTKKKIVNLATFAATQIIPLKVATTYSKGGPKQGGGQDGDPSTPFVSGGWTGPGPKYQPAGIVHAEEFVVKRGPAAKFRPWLEQMNQMPGYADGGYVQRMPYAASPAIDYDRLAAAMSAIRPLYGDVHLQPHNYNQFLSGMEQDRRMSSSDGVQR